ncbi:hypothetical protein E6W39_29240 [Kitasatospora acidiphila]|uniref:Phage tail protein n=1 Tax=Kitasatospora acidiphila TaxID=2567942 RepID=A0A540W971_9ACTN|nr:hypothetical protein [Kitasatospora acidiphila]TQF05570.1 hypothetical protein E6W39_29240 [Kitasatospora acidiphila]
MPGAYRYFTTHAVTGEVLSIDLPLADVEFGPELNGPGRFTGTLAPDLPGLDVRQLDSGTVLLWAERGEQLLWGGLVWRAEPDEERYRIEAAGFSSYLGRRFDLHGNLSGRAPYKGTDPCQVIADVWAYCQAQPDGDLAVIVEQPPGGSPGRLGTTEQPYTVKEWEAPSLAAVVRDAAGVDGGPEWTERVTRTPDGRLERRIVLDSPRLGTRRADLVFATGVNIIDKPTAAADGDQYAQVLVALGAGDGSAKVRTTDAIRDGRLRLEAVLDRPSITDRTALAALARTERIRRSQLAQVTEITVHDHPAAPIGSWQVGDDVRVQIHEPRIDFDGWRRIVGWTLQPDHAGQETATLHLANAYTS